MTSDPSEKEAAVGSLVILSPPCCCRGLGRGASLGAGTAKRGLGGWEGPNPALGCEPFCHTGPRSSLQGDGAGGATARPSLPPGLRRGGGWLAGSEGATRTTAL